MTGSSDESRCAEREAARGVKYKGRPIDGLSRLELITALAATASRHHEHILGTLAQFETLRRRA